MNLRTCILALALAVVGGCGLALGGGGKTGDLGGTNSALSAALAPYALLDLATREISYRADMPDLTDPAMRDGSIVFRKVGSGSGAFFIGIFELTQGQWFRIDGTSPWLTVPGSTVALSAQAVDRPAYNLDYNAIVASLAAFHLHQGARLGLPSSAQWETAAGTTSGWSWGPVASSAQIGAAAVVRESNAGYAGPQPVGSKAANPSGIFDMHGNVWEWTAPGSEVRGGSWFDSYWMSRVEIRPGGTQGLNGGIDHALVGARLVLLP